MTYRTLFPLTLLLKGENEAEMRNRSKEGEKKKKQNEKKENFPSEKTKAPFNLLEMMKKNLSGICEDKRSKKSEISRGRSATVFIDKNDLFFCL